MSDPAGKAKLVNFSAKDQIIKEGDRDRLLYVLRKGSVKVYKTYLGRKLTLAVLGPGEVFGELTFFDGQPRIANVEAIEPVEALTIDGEVVQGDLETLPSWMPGVFKTIISRLRETDNKLALLKNKYDLGSGSKDNDLIVKEVLTETLRIAKIFTMYFQGNNTFNADDLENNIREFEVLFGNTFMKVEKILLTFQNGGFLVEAGKSLSLGDKMGALIDYLERKLKENEIWLLSLSALRFLEDVMEHVEKNNPDVRENTMITDVYDQVSLENFKNYEDFFREAKAMGIVKGKEINIRIAEINTHLEYQRFMAGYNIRVE